MQTRGYEPGPLGDILVAVDLVENVEAARRRHLRLMQLQEVPAGEADQQADAVQEPPAVDLVEVHEAAAGLGQEAHMVVAELGREVVHRDLRAVREDPVRAEALRMVSVDREAARGLVGDRVEEWHAHTDQQVVAGWVAWTANTDQVQTEEEHAVGQETLTGVREVACPVDEQRVQREIESEGEAVGASSAV